MSALKVMLAQEEARALRKIAAEEPGLSDAARNTLRHAAKSLEYFAKGRT